MKTILFSVFFFAIASSSFSQNGWFQQSSGITTSLSCVYFVNENTGWVAGDSGTILHTSNGGNTWLIQNSNTTRNISGIIFKDANTGMAVGNYYEYNPWCFHHSIRLVTTDGGSNWTIQFQGESSNIEDFSSSDNNNFLLAYEGSDCWYTVGGIAKTTNNGTNWFGISPSTGPSFAYKSVSFIDSQTGWAVGYFATDFGLRIYQLIKTIDGGSNWLYVRRDSNIYNPDYFGTNMKFSNDNTGYIQGLYRNLRRTDDGGVTWNQTDSMATTGKFDYQFINPDTGWCIGSLGSIIRTNNSGANWTSQNSNVTSSLHSIYFVNDNIGYIVGRDGVILKTVTGGLTSVNHTLSAFPSSFALDQNYPNPFNPSTVIRYSLSENSFVSLKIFSSLGSEVTTLVDQKQNAGYYETTFGGGNLSSGIYFYSFYADGNLIATKSMVLMK